jgi:hypothetical protein
MERSMAGSCFKLDILNIIDKINSIGKIEIILFGMLPNPPTIAGIRFIIYKLLFINYYFCFAKITYRTISLPYKPISSQVEGLNVSLCGYVISTKDKVFRV